MRGRVDAPRQPARDRHAAIRQLLAEPKGDVERIGRRRARSDNRHDGPGERPNVAARPDDRRRIGNAAQESRKARIVPGQRLDRRRPGGAERFAGAQPRDAGGVAPLHLGHVARPKHSLERVVHLEVRLMPDFLERGGNPRTRCGQHRQGDRSEEVHARRLAFERRRDLYPHYRVVVSGATAGLSGPASRTLRMLDYGCRSVRL